MTKHTKALIFSALVLPGLGQFHLKRYKTAFLFMGAVLVSLIFIMTNVMTIASSIADKIIAGELSSDYLVIRQAILDQQVNSNSPLITFFTYSLIGIWLISVIDILRIKKLANN